jgi:hypothetical protein
VQSSWAADSIEPQPDKAKVAIKASKLKGRNVVEFISEVYLILEFKLRESEYLWNLR